MTQQKSWFILPYTLKKIKFGGDSSFRFPEQFAEKLIKEYTKRRQGS